MKVYHGGFTAIEKPEILESKFPKDFGEGFYCNKLESQAERWASRYDTAVVSIYEYTPNKTLKTLVFEEMTEKWLDFIVECRSGVKHNYDIVIGAMANDQIYNYISDFIDGILNREQFWVLAKFKHPTHQVCFCSDKSLKTLQFTEYKTISNYDRKRR
ncbi:MAG: DUF3990 domain-containing protein [Salinivirgaceae bacterium]